MNYFTYLMLTMGLRWLGAYLRDNTNPVSLKQAIEKRREANVGLDYTIALYLGLLVINYGSYQMLKYSLPVLVKLIKEVF